MRVFTFNFKAQFAPPIETGAKRQTVRALRKDGRRPAVGDTAKLYVGLRTRSTRLLLAAPVVQVATVMIDFSECTIALDAGRLSATDANAFAIADGFTSWPAMLKWFRETHGEQAGEPPFIFEGFLTLWDPEAAPLTYCQRCERVVKPREDRGDWLCPHCTLVL